MTKLQATKRIKYLLNKENCCPLDKDELYELQDLLDEYGYPDYED